MSLLIKIYFKKLKYSFKFSYITNLVNKMSNTYEVNQYSVLCSLNERSIYLKITDKIAFLCYEGNFDLKDFRLTLDLKDIYQVLCNCFTKEEGYAFTFTTNSETMKLSFNAVVGGFLRIASELLLREKIMSNDGQLTMNFNRLEQQYLGAIEGLSYRILQLERMVERLSNADVCMHNSVNSLHFKLNMERIILSGNSWNYNRIKEFFNLRYLEINGSSDMSFSLIENDSVEHLKINNCNAQFISLSGIQKLPNLTTLELVHCGSISNIVAVLSLYPHIIKEINIQRCSSVNQVEINTYCTQKKIKLTYT